MQAGQQRSALAHLNVDRLNNQPNTLLNSGRNSMGASRVQQPTKPAIQQSRKSLAPSTSSRPAVTQAPAQPTSTNNNIGIGGSDRRATISAPRGGPIATERKSTGGGANMSTHGSRLSQGRPSVSGAMGGGRPSLAPNSRLSVAPAGGRMSILGSRPGAPAGGAGRPSLSANSGRRSSVYMSSGGSGESIKVDPRPVKDKEWMNGCIQHLIQYLTENNYDKPISMRTLSAPSQQDFKQIVEFLFMQVDPSFRLCIPDHASNKRPEEEIPVLFKHLKYPFQMSSRSLLSVGSPHTWPALLAALHWLIELLVYDEVARHTREEQATAAAIIPVDDSGAPMQQYAPMDRLFFAFVTEAYGAFMAGLDDADQLENDFIQTYEERNQQLCYTTEAIQANTRQISNDMTVLANDKNRVHNLKEKLALLQRDNEKFKNLISSLEAHKKQAQKKRQDCVAELQRQEQELAALQAERAQLDSIFRKQQAEELDVDKINKERTELEENISIESSHRQQIEQSVQGQEMELSKKFDYAEQRIAVFNQMCRQQGLVRPSKAGAQQFPSTPVRASSSYMPSTPGTFRDDDTNSVEYFETEMRFNPYAQQMLSHDAKAFVKPQLKRFLQVTRQRLAHQQEQLFQLNETIDQLEDTIKMERATLNDAVVQAHAVESNYQRNREAFDESQRATEAAISMEIDSTRTRFAEHKARLLQLEQSKSLAERQLSEKKDKYQRERDQLATAMMQVIDMVANHKQLISDKLSSLLSHMRSKKQEFDQFAQIQSLHMNLHRRQSMNQ